MARNRRLVGVSNDSDVQMMETDIMRFLAIIALCLAVIFAIVSASASSQANVEVKAETETQKETVKVDAAKPTPKPVVEPIVQHVDNITPIPVAQSTEVIEVAEEPVDTEEAIDSEPTIETEQVETPPVAQDESEEEKGFELRFESDTVFSKLINAKLVTLYKIKNGQYFQWQNGWKHTGINGQYYQLHRSTIPNQYVKGTVSEDQFGVVLPGITQKALQRFTSEFESGVLIINQFADVARQPLP